MANCTAEYLLGPNRCKHGGLGSRAGVRATRLTHQYRALMFEIANRFRYCVRVSMSRCIDSGKCLSIDSEFERVVEKTGQDHTPRSATMAYTITSQAKNGVLDVRSAQAPTAYGALERPVKCTLPGYKTSPSRRRRTPDRR